IACAAAESRPFAHRAIRGLVLLTEQASDEIRSASTGEVAVDDVVVQEKRVVEEFNRRRDAQRGVPKDGAIALRGRQRVKGPDEQFWSQELPPKHALGCQIP